MDDNDLKDRAYWQEVCDILENHKVYSWTYKQSASLLYEKDNFIEYVEFKGRVANKLISLAKQNKKLKALIKKIHEDLKLREELDEEGYRVLNISHGTLLEIEEVLKCGNQ